MGAVRAAETQRPDALVRDPWAAALAGEEGQAWLAARSPGSTTPIADNRLGFAHLAFSVADVAAARAAVLAAGGRRVGEIVTVAVAGGGRVTWCYVTDPEGNVIELQSRSVGAPGKGEN